MASDEGRRDEERDHALTGLDQKEVRDRLVEAMDNFVETGFEVHLVAVKVREKTEFYILLADDGADDIPLRRVQEIADEFRLDIFFEKGRGLCLYARW